MACCLSRQDAEHRQAHDLAKSYRIAQLRSCPPQRRREAVVSSRRTGTCVYPRDEFAKHGDLHMSVKMSRRRFTEPEYDSQEETSIKSPRLQVRANPICSACLRATLAIDLNAQVQSTPMCLLLSSCVKPTSEAVTSPSNEGHQTMGAPRQTLLEHGS